MAAHNMEMEVGMARHSKGAINRMPVVFFSLSNALLSSLQ